MAKLRLRVRVERTHPYLPAADKSGVPVVIPAYRLYVSLYFAPPEGVDRPWQPEALDYRRRRDAVLDTGSTLTVLPFAVWRPFADEIRWLDRPASLTAADTSVAVAGSICSYRLGQVRLAAFDEEMRWHPPGWTVAQCLDDTPRPPPPLLGLRSPLLTRRQLRHAGFTPGELPVWWLEDAAE